MQNIIHTLRPNKSGGPNLPAPTSLWKARLKEWSTQFSILTRNKLNVIALVVLGLFILSALLAPYVAPYKDAIAGKSNLEEKLEPPSWKHLFGTDELGRDIFSRVLYGARISLWASAAAVALAMAIGVPLGAIAGGFGGWVDAVIMRIVDIFMSFPWFLIGILFATVFGPSLKGAILAIALSWWPGYSRIVRSMAISIRERQYVKAARAIGTDPFSIIFRHVLPGTMGPTIIQASLDFASVVLALAALSFLGLGAQPPTPEWGLMINTSRQFFLNSWWYMFFPGAAILVTVLCFNILGDGLREMLEPKSRTS
jgi:peptide/nickel transport system permease protein